MNNVILCGFMGCGKTTVGKALADRLSRSFIDMDDEIERRENKKIPAIFNESGEEGFRKAEHEAALAIAAMGGIIVATGGGALTRPENVSALGRSGVIVYLNADFEACYSRIKDSDRPLVRRYSHEQLEQLYIERAAVYRSVSDVEIEVGGDVGEVAAGLVGRL